MKPKPNLAAVLLATAVVTGCAIEDEGTPTYGDGLGTAESPIPQDGVGYAVTTHIDLAQTPSSPSVAAAVAGVRAFARSPARALLEIAQGASVPELAQLYTALSSTLESGLEAWINTEVDKPLIGAKTARQYASDLAGFAETTLTTFGIDSTLSFSPDHTTHTTKGVVFRLAGFEVVIPTGGLKADAIGQEPDVAVAAAGAITFGEQRFGLAFGDHAWHAINLASAAAFGAEVRTTLGKVNCRAVADAVATKCVTTGVCVGHANLLAAICERGLDLIVADLQAKVTAVGHFDMRYLAGTARLVDENGDGLANRIVDGFWEAEMSLDVAAATFMASTEGR